MVSPCVSTSSSRCLAGDRHVSQAAQSCTPTHRLQYACSSSQYAAPHAAVIFEIDHAAQPSTRRTIPALAAAPASAAVTEEVPKPSAAETARTVLELTGHGTLATVDDDDKPLGTYASYVLDGEGQPVLRLRADAVHTANLLRDPHCSLFVQPTSLPARLLARVTLKGHVSQVEGPERDAMASLHTLLHGEGVGVDAPQESDLYYRLHTRECFYVGGLGASAAAEVIGAADLSAAQPDKLRSCAASLVEQWNLERAEDVMRIAAEATHVKFDQLLAAQLLWVDRLGMYLYIQKLGSKPEVHRAAFMREVTDERDARSVLTMLAQVSWENERQYRPPVMPAV